MWRRGLGTWSRAHRWGCSGEGACSLPATSTAGVAHRLYRDRWRPPALLVHHLSVHRLSALRKWQQSVERLVGTPTGHPHWRQTRPVSPCGCGCPAARHPCAFLLSYLFTHWLRVGDCFAKVARVLSRDSRQTHVNGDSISGHLHRLLVRFYSYDNTAEIRGDHVGQCDETA